MIPVQVPPAWYPDPHIPGSERWWDGTQWTDQYQASITEQSPGEIGAAPAAYSGPPILVVTTNEIVGYRITAVHGEVFGLTVRARNRLERLKDVPASISVVTGSASFLRICPAMAPRTLCACQPVVSMIWAAVTPSGRRSRSTTWPKP